MPAPDPRLLRIQQIEDELAEISRHKVIPDLVGPREGELLEELDRLDYEVGKDYLEGRAFN